MSLVRFTLAALYNCVSPERKAVSRAFSRSLTSFGIDDLLLGNTQICFVVVTLSIQRRWVILNYSPVSAPKAVLQLLRGSPWLHMDHPSSWFDHANKRSVSWSQNYAWDVVRLFQIGERWCFKLMLDFVTLGQECFFPLFSHVEPILSISHRYILHMPLHMWHSISTDT